MSCLRTDFCHYGHVNRFLLTYFLSTNNDPALTVLSPSKFFVMIIDILLGMPPTA